MNPRRRRFALAAALLGTLAATWWASTLEEAGGEAAAPRPRLAGRPKDPAAPPVTLADLARPRPALTGLAEGFLAPRSFQPPPPAPAQPPKPSAPPLPFRYVGGLEEGAERSAFLLEGAQVRVVKAGDELGGVYRVERVTSAAIEFTYLPLQERQVLLTARP